MASYAQGAGQTYQHSQQHHHQYQPSWSLNDLSTELLALIFEQVGDNPSRLHILVSQLICLRGDRLFPGNYTD